MLDIQNISVKYDKDYILKNFSISIDNNDDNILGILGKNGAGKTTLFNTIFGMLNFSGNIFWKNNKVKKKILLIWKLQIIFTPISKVKNI